MAGGDIWTVRDALEWTTGYLERKGDTNARLSSEKLMSFAVGLPRIEVYANYDKPLSMQERDTLRSAVQKRASGEPLQYIIGEVGFRHIDLKVRKGVLIPRPETEVLVSEVLAELPSPMRPRSQEFLEEDTPSEEGEGEGAPDSGEGQQLASCSGSRSSSQPIYVADLCTGSGCIACSLAYEHPDVTVFATDISPEAISLAEENTSRLGLSSRVSVIECDLGDGIDATFMGKLDAIVSNPPYVPTDVMSQLPVEVGGFEPTLALDGGADGLDVYRRILAWAVQALKPDGVLAVELHETCLDEAADLARIEGFSSVRVVKDLAEKPRVLVARL